MSFIPVSIIPFKFWNAALDSADKEDEFKAENMSKQSRTAECDSYLSE